MQIESFTNLSLFQIFQYTADEGAVFDFLKAPRPCFFLAAMLEGSAVFENNLGEKNAIETGDLLFIPKGAKYRSTWGKTSKNVYISLRFDFEPLAGFKNPESLLLQKFAKEDVPNLAEQLEEAYRLSLGNTAEHLRALSVFYGCLAAILPLLRHANLPANDRRLSPAIDYIRTHLSEDTPAPYLARLCSMSEPNLYLLFRKQMRETPVEYKNRLRIERAMQLLQAHRDMPIEEIAEAVGYETSAYFRRRFKDFTGESPREFRKRSTEKL